MYTWLVADLAANTKPWVIAYWHHPAYTKGTHDSDNTNGGDPELRQMRENFVPVLEASGVDLVLAGHSHVYERSYLIDGHYGLSNTFVNTMKVNGGDGKPAGDGAYTKGSVGAAAHQGAVYVTAGSSGQVGGFNFGGTHPAMKVSLSNLGSLVIDVNGNRLDATMVRENATTPDTFTLIKGTVAGNIAPSVTIAAPVSNTAVATGTVVPLTATASDVNGGTITQVAYYANGQLLGSSAIAPYLFNWPAPVGLHRLTARATDNAASVHLSSPVFLSVTSAFDVDGNGQVDALTDGLLALRYMFGLRGAQLTVGALGPGSYRDDVAMGPYFTASTDYDIDGNNTVDALTDGLLLIRYLFGLRGATLTNGALGPGPTRTGPQIEAYLAAKIP